MEHPVFVKCEPDWDSDSETPPYHELSEEVPVQVKLEPDLVFHVQTDEAQPEDHEYKDDPLLVDPAVSGVQTYPMHAEFVSADVEDAAIVTRDTKLEESLSEEGGNDQDEKKTWKCVVCGDVFGSESLLLDHSARHTPEGESNSDSDRDKCCDRCGIMGETFHKVEEAGAVSYVCSRCCMEKPEDPATDIKLHPCPLCDKIFPSRRGMRRHKLTHTAPKNHTCPTCSMAFLRPFDLKLHLLTHSEEKPHVCDTCGKGFSRSGYLKLHQMVHTGLPKDFPCLLCDMKFTRKSSLRAHLQVHQKDKFYTCNICNKTFTREMYLRRHVAAHSGVRRFKCPKCQKAFMQRSHLQRHLSRPYACLRTNNEWNHKNVESSSLDHDKSVNHDYDGFSNSGMNGFIKSGNDETRNNDPGESG